jgi:hypothetical protein
MSSQLPSKQFHIHVKPERFKYRIRYDQLEKGAQLGAVWNLGVSLNNCLHFRFLEQRTIIEEDTRHAKSNEQIVSVSSTMGGSPLGQKGSSHVWETMLTLELCSWARHLGSIPGHEARFLCATLGGASRLLCPAGHRMTLGATPSDW